MAKLTIAFTLNNVSASSFAFSPYIKASWTPVASSVSFTASGKSSRGGAGLLAGLFSKNGRIDHATGSFGTFTAITQENDFTNIQVQDFLETEAGLDGSLEQTPYIKASWTPVASSVSFTASGKSSRGGAGLLAGLFSKTARGQTTQHSALQYSTATRYITTSTVTTNRTQTGTSRLQTSVTQTQSGVSLIQITTTQNQSGVTLLTGSTQQTLTGTSNIYNTTTRNQSGVSRIQISSTQTQSGITRIIVRTSRTQPGVANIYATTTKTVTGRANIRNTTTRNQSGVSKISNSTAQTITGTARISSSTLITQAGRASIRNTTTRTQSGDARITTEHGANQYGTARIANTTDQLQTGNSRIQTTASQTQSGDARIFNSSLRTIFGRTRIADPLLLSAPLFDVRDIEEPESIAGTMVFDSDTARYEDWLLGRFNFQYGHGHPSTNPMARPNAKQNFTAADFLRTEIRVSNVDEEGDITIDSTTIDGDLARTSDWITGALNESWATISNRTNAVLTQATTEVLWGGDEEEGPNCRFTGVSVEVCFQPDSNARHTQTAVEVLRQINVGWIQQTAIESMGNQISALRYALIQQCALEVMYSIKAKVRLSQIAHELLKGANPDPPVNLTSVATEVLRQRTEIDTTPSFIQQMALECLRDSPNPPAVIGHAAIEWAIQPFPPASINHAAMEWVRNASSIPAWVNHSAMEIVRDAAATPTFVNHIAIEVLVRREFDPTVSSLINNPKYFY